MRRTRTRSLYLVLNIHDTMKQRWYLLAALSSRDGAISRNGIEIFLRSLLSLVIKFRTRMRICIGRDVETRGNSRETGMTQRLNAYTR